MSTGDLRTETKKFLTFYGVFNSNFFHHIVSPFCISSQLKPIHIIFLSYISAFYPFLLIFVTWFCVELHGCNCRPIASVSLEAISQMFCWTKKRLEHKK